MIYLQIPLFPPSVNNAYFDKVTKAPGKGRFVVTRVLTSAGRKFKRELKTWIAKNHPEAITFFNSPSGEYSILVVLHLEKLYNTGWPKSAKRRHKKIDASNYLKVLEDGLTEACGHDDCQHVSISVKKTQAPEGSDPFIQLWAWNAEEDDGPIELFLHRQPY